MRVRENALLQKDEVIGKGKLRWVVGKRIGDGGFAEVYEGQDKADPEKKYAIKIERYKMKEGGAAKREISVLRDIELKALVKLQACPQVVRLVKGGLAQHNQHVFIVMERLGLNLADLRRTLPGNRFQPDKVKAYGVSMLHALEGVHRGGYIHRDVKPANFALSANPEEAGTVYVLDFGVARRYLDEQGQVLPMRTDYHQFRGSTTYASVNALNRVDLGRRDDLWSWLYMLVEMLNGSLPWRTERSGVTDSEQESPEDRKENDKRATLQQKQHCIAHPEDLTTHVALPDALRSISGYLEQLSFEAEPDYNALRLQLEGLVLPEQPQATWPADPAANGQHAGWAGNGHAVHAQQGAAWPQQYDPHMQAHWQYGVAGHPLHGHHIPPGGMPNGLPMPLGVSDTPLSPPEEDVGHHLYAAQHYQTAPAVRDTPASPPPDDGVALLPGGLPTHMFDRDHPVQPMYGDERQLIQSGQAEAANAQQPSGAAYAMDAPELMEQDQPMSFEPEAGAGPALHAGRAGLAPQPQAAATLPQEGSPAQVAIPSPAAAATGGSRPAKASSLAPPVARSASQQARDRSAEPSTSGHDRLREPASAAQPSRLGRRSVGAVPAGSSSGGISPRDGRAGVARGTDATSPLQKAPAQAACDAERAEHDGAALKRKGSGEDDRPGLKRQRSERERSYDGDYVRPSGRDQPPTRSRLGREDSRGTYSPSRGEAHLDRRDRDRRETPDPRDPRDHRDRDHRDHRDHRDGRDERYRDDDRDRSRRDRDRDRDRSDRRDDRGRSREYERGRDSRSGRSTGREGDEGLKAIQQLVRNFRDGKDISSRAQRAKESLKSVDPVEAVSVVGWLLDAMVTHLKPAEMSQVGGLLDDLLPFVKDLSSRSWSKYGER